MSGKLTLISSAIVTSSTSTVDFTSGIDSTYDEYQFWWFGYNASGQNEVRIIPSTNGSDFSGIVKTTTWFHAYNLENGSSAALAYNGTYDRAQSTAQQMLTKELESGSDDGDAGCVHVFSPSSTSKVKHFMSRSSCHSTSNNAEDVFVAGYWNTTTAFTAFRFHPGGSDTIDKGEFYLYGVG